MPEGIDTNQPLTPITPEKVTVEAAWNEAAQRGVPGAQKAIDSYKQMDTMAPLLQRSLESIANETVRNKIGHVIATIKLLPSEAKPPQSPIMEELLKLDSGEINDFRGVLDRATEEATPVNEPAPATPMQPAELSTPTSAVQPAPAEMPQPPPPELNPAQPQSLEPAVKPEIQTSAPPVLSEVPSAQPTPPIPEQPTIATSQVAESTIQPDRKIQQYMRALSFLKGDKAAFAIIYGPDAVRLIDTMQAPQAPKATSPTGLETSRPIQ